MKALTLTQPWASLMAFQKKVIETRSWYTSYRGPLVIHAAKGFPRWAQDTCNEEAFSTALDGLRAADLPVSCALCIVNLRACIPVAQMDKVAFVLGYKPSVTELEFGDFSEGRYLWVTEFVQPILPPIPMRGALGLWEWPEFEEAASG